jgi:hypothetical protein
LVVLLLNAAKGAAAYALIARWGVPWLVWLGPLAVWAGHCFPIWLQGRGGVGQAALVAVPVTYLQGNSWLGIVWMVALMGLLIAKKLFAGPRQRRLLARTHRRRGAPRQWFYPTLTAWHEGGTRHAHNAGIRVVARDPGNAVQRPHR